MDSCFSEEAKDLINKLLVINPKSRLGSGIDGVDKLKRHPYFKNIDWKDLEELKIHSLKILELLKEIEKHP